MLSNDKQAIFEKAWAEHREKIYKFCLWKLSNEADAQECCQKAFFGFFHALQKGTEITEPYSWLMTAALRAVNKVYEKRKVLGFLETEHLEAIPDTYDPYFVADETIFYDDLLKTVKLRLSKRERELLDILMAKSMAPEELMKKYTLTKKGLESKIYRLKLRIKEIIAEAEQI